MIRTAPSVPLIANRPSFNLTAPPMPRITKITPRSRAIQPSMVCMDYGTAGVILKIPGRRRARRLLAPQKFLRFCIPMPRTTQDSKESTRILDAARRVQVLELKLMSEITVSLDRDVAAQLVKRIKNPFHVNVGSEAAFQKLLLSLEAALQAGDVSPNSRRPVAVGLHEAWTSEDDAATLRMRADHRPWREIAEELGRSVHAVKARRHKLEARRKPRRERED